MFKFMLEFKTVKSLHIKNRQGLTPLTLAAHLARKKVNYYIKKALNFLFNFTIFKKNQKAI